MGKKDEKGKLKSVLKEIKCKTDVKNEGTNQPIRAKGRDVKGTF